MCHLLFVMCSACWIVIALDQDVVNIPSCSVDTCIIEGIGVAAISTICVQDTPGSMTYARFLLNSSFHSDAHEEPSAAWVQQLRAELFVLLSLARSTNTGGIGWYGDAKDSRGLALDQVCSVFVVCVA